MYFFQNMLFFFFKKHVFSSKSTPESFHIPKNFGGLLFSGPQQFSESDNFGPLGAGGGCTVTCPGRWTIIFTLNTSHKANADLV